MFRTLATAAFAAALALSMRGQQAQAQKALVYCPVGIDASGCDRIVAALQPKFSDGVDRGYDGSSSTVDLKTADLQHYAVVVVPSLADGGNKEPYALLRSVAPRLRFAINGRVAVYSGAPDQGSSNRSDKDALIQNLAQWAAKGHTRKASLVGLVAFLDLSENETERYSWVRAISLVDVSADAEVQSIGDATAVSTRGGNLLSAGDRALKFSNMASYGLHVGGKAAPRTEVGAVGGTSSRQSILVTYANADGADESRSGSSIGQTGSTGGASFNMVAGSASLSTSASTSTATAPTLTTNKPDYLPGDTVTFTGTGFAAGDSVTITVHEDPTWSYPDRQFKSVADANGNFTNRQMIVATQDLGATFTATAVGNPSGTVAQATFTDGFPGAGAPSAPAYFTTTGSPTSCTTTNLPASAILGVAGMVNVNVPVCVKTTFTTNNGSTNGNQFDILWFAPSSNTVAVFTTSFTNQPANATTTVSDIRTPSSGGTWTIKICVTGSNCGGAASNTISSSQLEVVAKANQLITFNAPTGKAFGDPDFSLGATASSGLGVSYISTTSAVCTIVSNQLHIVAAGSCSVTASQAGDAAYNPAPDVSQTFVIDKATTTTIVTCPASVTYSGSAQTPCSAAVSGAGGLSQAVTPVTYTMNTDVGTAGASATYAGDANHSSSSGNATFAIAKATSTTTVSCTAGPFTYSGAAQTPCSVTVTGAGSLSLTPTPTYTDNISAGTATASYSFAGDANHESSSDTKTFTISKAPSTTTVTCTAGPFVYTGVAQTPCSVSVTGAGGLNDAPAATYANNIAAGTATASYSFAGDGNHNGSSDSKTFTIAKAASTTVVTCPASVTYTGSAQTPCTVAVTGASLSITPTATYANNTNAGTASAIYSFAGDDNHESSSDSKTFAIDVAASTTTVSCSAGPFAYNGAAQTPCTATATGAGGLNAAVTPVAYTNNTNAGTASASATYAGDANHSGSTGSTTFTIAKAASTTSVTCGAGPFIYNGSAQTPCSVSVTGAGSLSLTPTPVYASNTNVGIATASYAFTGDDNHEASSDSKDFTIEKAASTTLVTCPASVTFDGTPQTPCSVAVSGASLSLTPSATYVNNTNAGTATASYTFAGDGNHTGSNDSKTFAINKAASATTVTCPASVTYDGSAQTPCTAAASGVGGLNAAVTPVTYTANTNAGTAGASASYAGDANHLGSTGSANFTIDRAASTTTVTCTAGPFTYTGAAQTPCSVAVTGVGGLSLTPTANYANNTDAGTATASYLFAGDPNHNGSTDSKTFTISKASSTTAITCPVSVTFNGSAQTPCSVEVSGASLSLTPSASYANNTNAGTATASYSFAGDANHESSSDTKTFTIAKASSATVITCPASVTFTGSPLAPCSATVTGAGGLSQTPTPTYANNTNAGTASASYSFAGDANHEASSDSKAFTIAKATSTTAVSCTGGPFTYTGSAQTPCSVAVTGVGGLNQTPSPTYANNVNAGTATASYAFAGDANHEGSSDSESFTIAKAGSTVSVTCAAGPFVYNGSPQTPCSASVSGVGGLAMSLTPLYSNNTDAGTATASATYAGDPNHNGSSGSQQFTIDKAPANVLLNNLVQPVNNVQSPTATATPVGSSTPVNVSFTFTYTVNGSQTQTRPTQVGVYPLSVDIVAGANYTGHADGYFVIYDPSGGFVTGGGWIVADAGSCVQLNAPAGVCEGATGGRANFGFVSKYEKGATTPSGNTEFQFQAGNLNFKSTSYQWLVVSGARAQYKGSGSINGQSGYDFILTAVDGGLPGGNNQDRFRMKITRGDVVVFDNQITALDGDALTGTTTALAGGSISIKSK